MWTPWTELRAWGRARHQTAVENAREAATACSRARLERIEIEQYVEELVARKHPRPITA
jgi:hypothetical protein